MSSSINLTPRKGLLFGLVFILFFIAVLSCLRPIEQRFLTEEEMSLLPDDSKGSGTKKKRTRNPCHDKDNYQIDTSYLDHFPMRYIRINFHWMNSLDGTQNIPEKEARPYIKNILHAMNYALKNNKKMWLPHDNDTPVHPINIQYVLSGRPNEPEDDGIYFHYDDSLYFYVHIYQKDANLFTRKIIDKYGVQLDTVLNFFLMPHHADSLVSKTYRPQSVGVALRNAFKVAATWKEAYKQNKDAYWNYRGTINHEVGHVLGLRHAWTRNDGCNDTPIHKNNCWSRSNPGCDTMTSNNLMDYSALQLAWTPCQIAKAHLKLSDERYKPRGFLVPTWCTLNEEKDILIRDSIVWPSMKDLEGNLTIANGGQLTIRCRVSMPPAGTITIQSGGRLIVDGGQLHQACGQKWKGIIVEKQYDEEGIFELLNSGRVEDVK